MHQVCSSMLALPPHAPTRSLCACLNHCQGSLFPEEALRESWDWPYLFPRNTVAHPWMCLVIEEPLATTSCPHTCRTSARLNHPHLHGIMGTCVCQPANPGCICMTLSSWDVMMAGSGKKAGFKQRGSWDTGRSVKQSSSFAAKCPCHHKEK